MIIGWFFTSDASEKPLLSPLEQRDTFDSRGSPLDEVIQVMAGLALFSPIWNWGGEWATTRCWLPVMFVICSPRHEPVPYIYHLNIEFTEANGHRNQSIGLGHHLARNWWLQSAVSLMPGPGQSTAWCQRLPEILCLVQGPPGLKGQEIPWNMEVRPT